MASTLSFKKKPVASAPANAALIEAHTTVVVPPAVAPVIKKITVVASVPQQIPTAPPAVAVAPPAAPSVALVPAQTAALSEAVDYRGVGGFEGEFTARNMAMPYLALFQKMSEGFDENMEWLGQFVYDKSIPLGTSIKVVFLRASKSYVEKTEFGSGIIAQRFTKLADARAAGFTESKLQEAADLDLLIEVDANIEGVTELAHIVEGDFGYILARYSVRSTSFGRTVGTLLKDSAGFLKDKVTGQGNLINGFYMLSSEKKTNDKGTYYVPQLKTCGPTPAGLRDEIVDRMGV